MKKMLAAAALFAATVSGAMAADLAPRTYVKAPEPIMPEYSWTGFYIGAVAGVGRENWGRSGLYDSNPLGDNYSTAAVSVGGTAGYNYQVNPLWVIGIEGDYSWINSNLNIACGAGLDVADGECYDSTSLANFKSTWLGTVRGRVGFLADPRLLIFVTGGVAFGDSTYGIHDYTGEEGTLTQTHVGWTVGGGAEYMLSQHWTAKGEYIHVDLGGKSYAVPGTTQPDYLASIKPTYDFVRLGLNYKFW